MIWRRRIAKHFAPTINEDGFRFTRQGQAIAREAKLSGIDVLQTGLSAQQSNTAVNVPAYTGLMWGETAFRCLKTVDLELRRCFP